MCIARIKEGGSQKEILFDDFYSAYDIYYDYEITNDTIYLEQKCYNDIEENNKKLYYYDVELCWLKKISLKTGEIQTLQLPCVYESLNIIDGTVYYGYPDIYTFKKESDLFHVYGNKGVYVSEWYDYNTGKLYDSGRHYTSYYSITEKSKQKLIYKDVFETKLYDICNNKMIFLNDQTIFIVDLDNRKKRSVYKSKNYINNDVIYMINDYVYFSEYSYINDNNKLSYCRIKADGTGLEKQDKPFEWFY